MKGVRFFVRFVIGLLCFGVLALFLFFPQARFFYRSEKSIAILAWPTDIDPRVIADFERETGVHVDISYFQDYGELFVKLRSGKGLGYDLVTPADYIVKPMVDQGLLKPLDTSRCAFWKNLNPQLLNLYYDKGNQYTLPYFWGVFGIGVNREAFGDKEIPASWKLIFDKDVYNGPLGMLDDAKEMVVIAKQYLFGSIKALDDQQIEAIQQLLNDQKKRVVMYTDNRAPYLLLSKTAPVVLSLSYEIGRVMRLYPQIDFIIPQEGTFLLVDNWAIPASSTKEDLVYQFLNYMYRKDVLKRMVEQYLFYPPVELEGMQELVSLRMPTNKEMQCAQFIVSPLTDAQLTNLWIDLKA